MDNHSDPIYDLENGPDQPYHLVNPSAWPLVSAFAAGLLAVGALMYMHDVEVLDIHIGLKGVIIGFIAVLACMWGWWKDVIHEAVVERAHSKVAKIGFRYGMILFIASEVMFFFAFFWAFFDSSLFPSDAIGGIWPPADVEAIPAFGLPFMMTMILLLSGCTITWAHHEILEGNQKGFLQGLGLTILLGIVFTFFQAYEYHHASFGFDQNVYSSAFYMATGFHGFHVLVGTIFLIVCYFRGKKGHFKKNDHFGFEAAAWYWHFVDIVWLFLFVSIYWWGNA